jgi:hypothetical protein
MNAVNANPTLANDAHSSEKPAGIGIIKSVRILAYPLLTNFWPALLFVSQKAFVVPGLLLVGVGDSAYRRDLMLSLVISLVSIFTYLGQYPNPYAEDHLIGFLIFAWGMPAINHAIRTDQKRLRLFLTYFTIFNAILGFFFLVSDIDLSQFRGLNKVVGKDGVVGRVYFESSSLAAVFLLSTFRRKWMKAASFILISAFVVFVARSVVVMMLLFVNLALPYVLRSSLVIKIMSVISSGIALLLIYIYLPVLRPDVDLSLNAKQFQLDLIFGSMGNGLSGWGWGAFFPELATDPTQPYQIEMQLPMLILQIGVVPFALIALLILAMIFSATDKSLAAFARFSVYLLIGFNNPWLFLPSWFLTCQLLFRYDDERKSQ